MNVTQILTLLLALVLNLAAAPIEHGDARFTVITPNLVRIEISPDRKFIDDRTLFAINRDASVDAQTKLDGEVLTIDTGAIRIHHRNGKLSGEILVDGRWIDWSPEMKNEANLGGTIRTLDGVAGPVDVGEGILSRNGWYLLDDSRSPLLTGDWVKSRPRDAGTDWYLFGYGHDYRAAFKSLAAISGPVPMPRRYMLGAWYSRYWPYSSKDYRAIVQEYSDHDFPLDVIVMDMDWHITEVPGVKRAHAGQIWTGYTWDRTLLPDAEGLLKWFHEQGLHVTLNDHPADGVQPHESMYDAFMKAMDEDPATQKTISFDAGSQKYLDTFWKFTHQPLLDAGVDFWWLDWQQFPFTRSIPDLSNLAWLNKYYYDHSAKPGERGASFSRWAGWGDHRHPIHFSGDADTGWAMLQFQVPFTATAGNVGCFFWSHDIGGHMGARNEESYARWCQFGAMTAALRSHSTRDANMDRRPWKYPKWAEDSMRKSFHLRSELFPYIYSSVAQSCRDMVPLTRPMYIDYPNLEEAYQNPQQFMLGDHLLVAPITSPGEGERKVARQVVWFPPGDDWFNWFTGERYEGGTEQLIACDIDTFPLFVRGGAPIPTQLYSPRMTAPISWIMVRTFPGKRSIASMLYEDDGISTAYLRDELAITRLRSTSDQSVHEVDARERSGKLAPQAVLGFDVRAGETRQGVTGLITKNESPSGYPFRPKMYLFLPVTANEQSVEWELKQGETVLAKRTTEGSGKIVVPEFDSVRRPTDLRIPIELIAKPQAANGAVEHSLPVSILDRAFDVARTATATASSTENGYTAAGAIDGNASGYPHGKQFEWASEHEKTGAWITLEWKDAQTIDTILLYDRPNTTDHVTGGLITFDDGSTIEVGELPNDGSKPVELNFKPKTVRSLTFKVTEVSAETQNAGISEIAAFPPASR
ncbi:hypothetical protein BH09PLA1_BH09PLA1_29940 [soil metagenome]